MALNTTMLWLVLIIIFVLVELFTMGLTTIWFAIGSLGGFLASLAGLPLWVQCIVFVVLAVVMLFFTRPFAVRYFNRERVLTNAEGLIGRDAIVTSEVDNRHGVGHVTIDGQEWSARSEDDKRIFMVGDVGQVVAISGVKLIIRGR